MSADHQNRHHQEPSLFAEGNPETEERFEVECVGDTFVYSVQKCGSNRELVKCEPPSETSEVCGEPQRLSGPVGTRVVVYRKGSYELEIDIPAISSGDKAIRFMVYYFLLTSFVQILLSSLMAALAPSQGAAVRDLSEGVPWIAVLVAISLAIRALFVHENIVVTPTSFRIRKTLEFVPQARDSVNNSDKARGNHRLLEMIFYRQVARPTSTLSRAEVKARVTKDGRKTNKRLALMEGAMEHKLYSVLSDDERTWLAREIDETLENIRAHPHGCHGATGVKLGRTG